MSFPKRLYNTYRSGSVNTSLVPLTRPVRFSSKQYRSILHHSMDLGSFNQVPRNHPAGNRSFTVLPDKMIEKTGAVPRPDGAITHNTSPKKDVPQSRTPVQPPHAIR